MNKNISNRLENMVLKEKKYSITVPRYLSKQIKYILEKTSSIKVDKSFYLKDLENYRFIVNSILEENTIEKIIKENVEIDKINIETTTEKSFKNELKEEEEEDFDVLVGLYSPKKIVDIINNKYTLPALNDNVHKGQFFEAVININSKATVAVYTPTLNNNKELKKNILSYLKTIGFKYEFIHGNNYTYFSDAKNENDYKQFININNLTESLDRLHDAIEKIIKDTFK